MIFPDRRRAIVLIIVISQLACVFFVSYRKQEFHIDEIYSYVLSNSYHVDKLSNDDGLWGRWTEGDSLSKYITVQHGERFAFRKVYRNNSTDCHPPLYYWSLHSICSLMPNAFSKWSGLGLNILFFLIALVFIYKISLMLLDDSDLVYLPVILYGFSPMALETITFIRMYMLITMLAVVLMYIHLMTYRFGITKRRMIAVWLILYLGSMTHYYFVVLGFWAAVIFAIQNRREKKGDVIKYATGCLAAEALFVSTYPYVISQAMGTETNNVGSEIMKNLFNWRLWIQQTINLVKSQVEALSYMKVTSAIIATLLICLTIFAFVYSIHKHEHKDEDADITVYISRFMVWLATVYACTFLSISFIGGEYVFLRYIYYIGPSLYILIAYIVRSFCRIKPQALHFAVIFAIAFAVSNFAYGTFNDMSPYLYREDYKNDMLLKTYHDYSLIVMTSRNPAVPTGNLTKMMLFERVYISDDVDILGKNIVGECLGKERECVVYIDTDTYFTDGYDAAEVIDEIKENNNEAKLKAERLCDGSLGEFYLLSTQTTS